MKTECVSAGRILLAEDEDRTTEFLVNELRREGFAIEQVNNGPDCLHQATAEKFDGILLDRHLSGLDGLSVLRALRAAQNYTPVIVLSALARADECVVSLRAGAQDYLAKPFAFPELHARLDNLLQQRKRSAQPDTTLRCADLELDQLNRRATRAGQPIKLMQRDFQVLQLLMKHKDRTVTHAMFLNHIWDRASGSHASLIDTGISRLRKKIEAGGERALLHTIRNVGYRLSEQP